MESVEENAANNAALFCPPTPAYHASVRLTGDAFAHVLAGGGGKDTGTGGSGSDGFDYNRNHRLDTIVDFAPGAVATSSTFAMSLVGYSTDVSNAGDFRAPDRQQRQYDD